MMLKKGIQVKIISGKDKGKTGEVHDYLIDLGPDCNWKLAIVNGYTESLKVSEGATCLHIGNFANVISAS